MSVSTVTFPNGRYLYTMFIALSMEKEVTKYRIQHQSSCHKVLNDYFTKTMFLDVLDDKLVICYPLKINGLL